MAPALYFCPKLTQFLEVTESNVNPTGILFFYAHTRPKSERVVTKPDPNSTGIFFLYAQSWPKSKSVVPEPTLILFFMSEPDPSPGELYPNKSQTQQTVFYARTWPESERFVTKSDQNLTGILFHVRYAKPNKNLYLSCKYLSEPSLLYQVLSSPIWFSLGPH